MTLRLMLLLFAALASCASAPEAPTPAATAAPAPAATAVSAPVATPAALPPARPAPVPHGPGPAVPSALEHAAPVPPGAEAPASGPLAGRPHPPLLPPGVPGTLRAEVSGCAAASGEAEATRFQVAAGTRALPTAPSVAVVAGGALLTHALDHACCLKADVSIRLEGRLAVVRERLTGTPCRCRCGSTIRTALALDPGRWTVVMEVEDASGVRRIHEAALEVR